MKLTPLLLSGGSGTRLWPLSRVGRPKQFLPLTGDNSLYQLTLLRLDGLPDQLPPLVVCNEAHRFVVGEQAAALGKSLQSILLEPEGRNTAPAIALGALKQLASGEDALLLVLPCDHVFGDITAFQQAVRTAMIAARDGKVVTFGIVPTSPETGYGYVKAGDSYGDGIFDVARFFEKPNLVTAQGYLADGRYFWNSGMFLVKASVYMEQLRKFAPDIAAACESAFKLAGRDLDFCRADPAHFRKCRSDSIDYAVMEKTDLGVVVPMDAGWNDVGSWSSVWDVAAKDGAGNAVLGDVLVHESEGNYVHASSRLVTLLGVEGLAVIETADAVMVASREHAQDVKQLVDQLKARKRSEVELHREVFRPWGSYDSIGQGVRYQVKRISVKPGAKLSVQMHHHRAEHWIVVSGTAQVRIGDKDQLVTENQSVYIPIGTVHSLENPGKVPLELIEVQSGTYLGEDDIVRFEDRYGRT
jgi:mannose-1-phosphate guanylyltransferase